MNGWRGDAPLLGERDWERWGYTGLSPWSDGGGRGGKKTQPRIKLMSVHRAVLVQTFSLCSSSEVKGVDILSGGN